MNIQISHFQGVGSSLFDLYSQNFVSEDKLILKCLYKRQRIHKNNSVLEGNQTWQLTPVKLKRAALNKTKLYWGRVDRPVKQQKCTHTQQTVTNQ